MRRILAALSIVCLFLISTSCTKSKGPKEVCFYFSKSTIKLGDTVYLFNCSKNMVSNLWILPDGSTDDSRHSAFKPTGTGTYSVWLRIGGDYAMTDTIGKSQTFTVVN